MNATGESDLVNYIDLLVGLQKSIFDPRIKIIDTIIQAHFGIPEWTYRWNSIFPESNVDRANRAKDVADSITSLVDKNIITPEAAIRIMEHEKIFGDLDLGQPPTDNQKNDSNKVVI